jgi:light-regulated signal transduction histidine kinase (bacteriophytochrome)
VKRKELIARLRSELEDSNAERNMWRLSYQGSKQHVCQLQKELADSRAEAADAEAKWRNLELALQMEQKQRGLVEENLRYYMELCAEQVKFGSGTFGWFESPSGRNPNRYDRGGPL